MHPRGLSISRNITLAGNGGIDVALHPFILSGNISGAGQLIKRGAGELELTGTNTYAGGTCVGGGGLRVNSDDKLGAAGTGISFAGGGLRAIRDLHDCSQRSIFSAAQWGTFQVDEGKTLTLTGIVSGPKAASPRSAGARSFCWRPTPIPATSSTTAARYWATPRACAATSSSIPTGQSDCQVGHLRPGDRWHFRRQHHRHRQRHQDRRAGR